MREFVQTLNFEHPPALDCILDLVDENWKRCFTTDELHKLNTYGAAEIQYSTLPKQMHDY
ncbi:hypothetical protein PS15m_012194 [Mucor circinelloides]